MRFYQSMWKGSYFAQPRCYRIFLGHNGAGKTTTISMLTTLLLPTSGMARVLGLDVVKQNLAVRQCIGYVPEQVRLYNDLTVEENLAYFAALSGVTDISQRIHLNLIRYTWTKYWRES